MTSMIQIQELTLRLSQQIAANLCQADRAELEKSGVALDELAAACVEGDENYAVIYNHQPVAMYGCVDLGGGLGGPWLLCTSGAQAIPNMRRFALARRELRPMKEKFKALQNAVSKEHKQAQRFISALGFTLGKDVEHLAGFRHFFWEKTDV
jgi:hypothetical protein